MGLLNFLHFIVVAFPHKPLLKSLASFTQQLLRYLGIPQEGVVVGTFVKEVPCTESTALAVMRQSLHL